MPASPSHTGRTVSNVGMAIGLAAGLAFGVVAAVTGSEPLLAIAQGVAPLGTAFIRAVQMVVIPLVLSVVFVGVARIGDLRRVGRMGGLAMTFFWSTTVLAVLLGMGLMRLTLTWMPDVQPPAVPEGALPELPGLVDFLLGLIPANPFAAATEGALLPLIVFTVLFAAAAGTLPADQRGRLVDLADAAVGALTRLVHWVLWTGPVGVFGLIAPVAATAGGDLLTTLLVFALTVILGQFVFVGAVYLPLARIFGGMGPLRLLRGIAGTLTVGFTTTSSVATLPVMLEEAPGLGISPVVADLVLPLGASLNRAGSAFFQGASVVFLAALYDVAVPGGAWVSAVVAVFFAASTVAPVPSSGIFTLVPALNVVGIPVAGLGLLLGIDRVPDMFRSAVNMLGHMTGAVFVEARVGEKGRGDAGTG